ncbi:NAD(P)-dependent dehydrogenase (short-subunit alcohol dehydrogenase family) [Nakamurella sp. UYEF19]|uniref:SDR family NAD(P)-dependent oxidoreductase n=1 Tax=Nakamurella sp. UYEF19 TaxID=1756392 RepID=UPI00339735D4
MSSYKTVLISGTSTGIGAQTAVAAAAAAAGWHVVATMRDTTRSGALAAAAESAGVTDRVEIRAMDITDPASVAACVAGIVADHPSLDAVINNAGSGHVGTLEQETIAEVRAVMEVNFFGTLHVTREALPHLRASGGRVITVTSVGGVIGQPFNEAYCAAKFAVEGFMESLAPVAAMLGVAVVVVEPGAVASEFVSNVAMDQAAMTEAAGPYGPALGRYLERTAGAFASAQSPASAAAVVISVLTDTNPPFRLQTSEGARALVANKLADLDGSRITGLTTTWVS